MMPELSVIIPTRHRNDLLALCLSQLTPQIQNVADDFFTVIVTDDGSDSTAEAMIAEQFPLVRWVAGPKRGPAANRNNGARIADSQWLVFTDDDCIPKSGWLNAYQRAIEFDQVNNTPHDIYEGRTTCEAGLPSPLFHAPINETGGWLWSCNMAVRQSFFNILNGFDEEFPRPHLEDVDFRERAFANQARVRFLENAEVDHPPRPNNLGEKGAPNYESDCMMFYKMQCKGNFIPVTLRRIFSNRLRIYWHYRHHPDSRILLRFLATEVGYILRHAPTWRRKYQQRYHGLSSPYSPDTPKRLHYIR